MAKILVVDDNIVNRKLLVALLSHDGHLTAEAGDGRDALEVARAENPQLVISDIVMPTMDGFDFVRALRADEQLRGTPVIFYTANYHEREAQKLAEACDVARVLVKPCPAPEILKTVDQVMAGVSESGRFFMPETFDREHLLLVTNKLAEQSDALAASNSRLVALGILNVELASIRESQPLMQRACSGARNLIASRYAVLAIRDKSSDAGLFYATSGIDVGNGIPPAPAIDAGPLGDALRGRRVWRVDDADPALAGPRTPGFPPGYPAASAFLAVPLATPARSYGWLCLADKIGASTFSVEDERLLLGLGALVGQIHEIITARADLQHEAEVLRQDEGRYRDLAQDTRATLNRVYAVMGGVNLIAVQARNRDDLCNEVCRVVAVHGDYRVAYIDVVDPTSGATQRIAVDGNKADAAAFQQLVLPTHGNPHTLICNDLRVDPGVPFRQEMLDRGYRAIAALPLVSGYTAIGRLVLITEREGRFDAAEMNLLNEVAHSVALALTRIAGGSAASAA